MRQILIKESAKEMPNAQALGAFNSVASTGGAISESASVSGFQKVPVSELTNNLNEKTNDYTFKEWEKNGNHRVYVSGRGVYNTGKVKQTAYIDANTGKVNVFTDSGQGTKWNISQSESLKNKLEKYGRYVKRFKK